MTPPHRQSQPFNEKHDGVSGSFTFAAMFVTTLTDLAEVARQKSRDGYVNCDKSS